MTQPLNILNAWVHGCQPLIINPAVSRTSDYFTNDCFLLLFVTLFLTDKNTLTLLCPTPSTAKTGQGENNAFTLYLIELAI